MKTSVSLESVHSENSIVTNNNNNVTMTTRSMPSEVVNDVISLILQPSFKRLNHDIEHVLPWLRKRSPLLQHQETSVLADIVKNCALLSCIHDDIVIRQGDKGDCFYIVLRGSVSVYIDPRMTGEGDDGASIARSSGKSRRKRAKTRKTPPPPPQSEDSDLSQFTTHDQEQAPPKQEPTSQTEESESQKAEPEVIAEDEEESEKRIKTRQKKLMPLDRNKFGKQIVSYDTGKAFGELALVHRDSYRNATVIADEDTELMVIGQDLFDRSLRAEQESRYAEIRAFIEEHPFFNMMTNKLKKLLEMSIRKETYIFDTNIIKQGDPVLGLHFIISGQAKISIEPKKHKQQYIHLWPFEAGVDALSIEFEHLREARRAAILRKYEDPAVWETKPEDLVIRRTEGYAAIEKRMHEKHINLCTVQTKEVLGDVETLLGLSTYMHSVRCTSNTECFVLDTKNWERLIGKKTNTQTVDIMRAYVISKLSTRMSMRNADLIPLLGYLHQKLTEQTVPPARKVERFKTSKTLPTQETEMLHLLQYFREGKAQLIVPKIPGLVYYRELMHEKAKAREQSRRQSKASDAIKLRPLNRAVPKRQPRSMMQIRESLRQMMEAEVIEFENQEAKEKLKRKTKKKRQATTQQRGIQLESIPTPRKSADDQDKAMLNPKPSLLTTIKQGLNKAKEAAQTTPEPSDKVKQLVQKKKQSSPRPEAKATLITEMSRKDKDMLTLPSITEEKSFEEIRLSKPGSKASSNGDAKQQTVHQEPTVASPQQEFRKTRQHTSDSSFIDDTCVTADPVPLTVIEPTSTSTPRHPVPSQAQVSPRPVTKQPDDGVSTDSKVTVPKLPSIVVKNEDGVPIHPSDQTDAAGPTDSSKQGSETGASKWKTAMKFVNEKIQERLTKAIMEEETAYKDYETSEPSLRLLENRIRAFHIQYGEGSKTKNLPNLKRFKLDTGEEGAGGSPEPRPGGRVWIKRKTCKFANSEFLVKDHSHVRYQMVEAIPEFNKVGKSKVVLQQFLKMMNVQH